ncbi:transglutaminase domain-containing protein [Anaerosporobacter faecicola]|uniref:transglutaminase domain-containing protein n=1 Tax=Anaerosporobacter faecicola TaxID=2718714 RepID=UPI001A9C1FF3|nr:transglutaminase domain-containing protein [Anaerosporobacter faecicola]
MIMRRVKATILCILICISLINPIKATATTTNTRDEFVRELYEAIVNREDDVTITYTGSTGDKLFDEFEELIEEVYEIDEEDTSSDADYIRGLLKSYSVSSNGSLFIIKFKYYESLKETKKVDTKIAEILKSLDISSLSTYGKVKAIHDYLVNHVSYDTTSTKFSAYDGLFNKSTVCNGYALLYYKMLIEAGVPCRVVTGLGTVDESQMLHAWNLVKINKKWYCVDVTWDDPIGGNRVYYDYFLKGSSNFDKDHMATDKFENQETLSKYNISSKNYSVLLSDIKMINKATLKVSKTKKITLPVPEKATVKWKSSNTKVATVSKTGKVTAKAKGTATVSATVTLPNGSKKKVTTKITVKK